MRRGVFIGLGSNLGQRAALIAAALRALQQPGDVRVLRCSRLHETAPVGGPAGQPWFLNAVAELQTGLSAAEVLRRLLATEQAHGRVRSARNGPRTLDLDLLLDGTLRIEEPGLSVPHPRMWQREFVLAPLTELLGAAEVARLRQATAVEPAGR